MKDSLFFKFCAFLLLFNTLSQLSRAQCNATVTATGNTTFCSGSVTLSVPPVANTSYQWYNNNIPLIGSIYNSYVASSGGVYRCELYNSICGSYYATNSITVNGPATILPLGSLTFCTGSVTLQAYSQSAVTSYQWKLNGTNIAGATSNSYTASSSGSYTCVISNAQCGSSTTNALDVVSGSKPELWSNSPMGVGIDDCGNGSFIRVLPANVGMYSLSEYSTGQPVANQSSNIFSNIPTGYYTLTVDDGCPQLTIPFTFPVLNISGNHKVYSNYGNIFCGSINSTQIGVVDVNYFGNLATPFWDTYQWKLNGVALNEPTIFQPALPGWYSCSVSNTCGTAVSVDSLYISIVATPSTNITASGPLALCTGQSVTLTVSPTVGANYQWMRNGVNISGATSTSYVASVAGTYKVAVTNSPCPIAYSTDQIVTVTPIAAPNIVCNTPTILCSGQTATLETNTGAGNTYEWKLGGNVINGATSSTYVANITGTYSVKVTNAQGCYSQSAGITITSGLHNANITSINGNPVCSSGSTYNMNSNAQGNDVTGYVWKFNGAIVPGATQYFYSAVASTLSSGNYTVEVTNACGTTFSAPYVLTVNPQPNVPVVTTATGNNYFCAPATLLLNSTTQAGVAYQWYNGGLISGATNSSYTASTTGNYFVRVTNANGCFSQNAGVPIFSNGFIGSISPNVAGACSTHVYTASPATGVTYQWYKNGSIQSGATNSTFAVNSGGTYLCTMTMAGCGSFNAGAQPLTILTQVNVVTITAPITNICGSQTANLAATSSSYYQYQWKLNGNNIPGATSSSYIATGSGSYTCFVTQPCGTTTSNAIVITVNPTPTATITASGSTNLCNGASVTLNANTGTGLTYQWTTNGQTITGATGASYTTTVGGTYRCIITNSSGCSATSSFINVFTSIGTIPTASITPSGTVNLCTGATQTLTANTGNGLTYQWKNNGVNISGAASLSYVASTAGSYTVVVTSACGSATSAATTLNIGTVTATITPVGTATLCSGSVVLNANTGTGLTYQWKNNGVNITGATGASYNATTSGSYTVVVTATGSCSATSTATVVTIGSLNAAVTPAGTVTICSGSSTALSATAGTGYTYKWYRNNVLLSSTTQTFTTGTQGTYKCVVTSGSCTATTNSVVVNVPVTPTATVSYSTPLTFCSPGSVTFTANALSGATYQWENNSIVIPGATAQSYVATTAGAYRVKETKSGCSDYSSTKTVTTATSVTATITTPDPVTQCTGGTVNMSITSPIPGYSYQWKKNNTSITGATTTNYAATTTGSYTVTATAGCGTATSNTIAVTIGSVSAQITPATSATLCTGGTLTLTANTGSGYSYQWKKNTTNITGATASTYTVTTAGSYTVTITAPCGNATSAATVVTQAGTVTASVTPAGSSTVCSGSSITFTANTGTGYTYKWYRNNVLLTSTGQTFTTATAGSYKVEVSISGSCAVQSNTVTLTVINNATPTITAGGPTTFCAGQSVTFTANALTGAAYQWQKNSVNITGATAQTYTATTAGSYRVQETKSGCSKYSSKKTVTVNCRLGTNGEEISSDETENEITMEVYPNPFADKLNVNITSPRTEQTEIKLMDVLGKTIYTQMITTNTATELNTQLPAGVYIIATIVNGQTKVMHVVKSK